ncbi:Dabb family protein [Phocaeicola vulgatus]|uniref:Dabb family protein n=1 Tax=Phocaeicola vulgatus TaxID=821 RepID=UPI00356B3A8A
MVKHIVLFKLKETLSQEEKLKVMNDFKAAIEALPAKIGFIRHIFVGLNASCYFETGNIEQLADRLQEIIDGDFKQVHYDMEKYGWDGIALRVADVYENLKK